MLTHPYTVAERFCTLTNGHGRACTPVGERTVRIDCETELDFTEAQRATQRTGQILRVTPVIEIVDVLTLEVQL